MKNIICFGGGSGLPKAVLEPLKKYDEFKITSIAPMVDNGGSTGQLRNDFDVLPPGDIRRHILALSEAEEWKKKLWKFRFGHEEFAGGHRGHNFANVFIAGIEYITKNYDKVLEITHSFMKVKGNCLPATTDKVQLIAQLENGMEIIGENEIDVPKKHDANLKIMNIYLKPKGKAYPPVIDAINNADAIIIGPGDFYSSLMACFLPEGIKETIAKNKAIKIFICPAMTKLGETQGFDVKKFAEESEKYIGCALDYVLFNTNMPNKERIKRYGEIEPQLVEITPFDNTNDGKFIGKDLLSDEGEIKYDTKKLEEAIIELINKK